MLKLIIEVIGFLGSSFFVNKICNKILKKYAVRQKNFEKYIMCRFVESHTQKRK